VRKLGPVTVEDDDDISALEGAEVVLGQLLARINQSRMGAGSATVSRLHLHTTGAREEITRIEMKRLVMMMRKRCRRRGG